MELNAIGIELLNRSLKEASEYIVIAETSAPSASAIDDALNDSIQARSPSQAIDDSTYKAMARASVNAGSALATAKHARTWERDLPGRAEYVTLAGIEQLAHAIMAEQEINSAALGLSTKPGLEASIRARYDLEEARKHNVRANLPDRGIEERIRRVEAAAYLTEARFHLGWADIHLNDVSIHDNGLLIHRLRALAGGKIDEAAARDSTAPVAIDPSRLERAQFCLGEAYECFVKAGQNPLKGNGQDEVMYRRVNEKLVRAQTGTSAGGMG